MNELEKTIKTISSLFSTINEAGGNSALIVSYQLNRPLSEFLEICAKNGIGFCLLREDGNN
jgi:hypothetical protein